MAAGSHQYEEQQYEDQPAFHAHRRSLLWLALAPLIVGLIWLGALQYLGTTRPIEATAGRSMEPTLQTGDLAVMEGIQAQNIRLGDIVGLDVPTSVQSQQNYPARVLHRVIDMRLENGVLMVQTQGDGQPRPDPFLTPAVDINRRLVASVPKLGNALFYLQSSQGKIAIIGLLVLFLIYEAVRWATDTAEEVFGPEQFEPGLSGVPEFQQLATAIGEYGEHLRSHTRVVQELGGTTEELHSATEMQREVLVNLGIAVEALAERVESPDFRPSALVEALPPAEAPPEPSFQVLAEPEAGPVSPPPAAEATVEVEIRMPPPLAPPPAPAPPMRPVPPSSPSSVSDRLPAPPDSPTAPAAGVPVEGGMPAQAPPPAGEARHSPAPRSTGPGEITLGVVLRAASAIVLKRALYQIEALDARIMPPEKRAATPSAIPRPPRDVRLRTAARSAAERDRVRRYRQVGVASVRAMAAASQNRRQRRRRQLR